MIRCTSWRVGEMWQEGERSDELELDISSEVRVREGARLGQDTE